MRQAKRQFLKSLVAVCATAPLLPGFVRQALARSEAGYPRLVQGPMLGAVEPDKARIWMRGSGRFPVAVRYGLTPDLADARMSSAVDASAEDDYVARVEIAGLEPGTRYYYRPYVDGEPGKYMESNPAFSFTTAPAPDQAARFRVGFGSCARWQEFPVQPIWGALQRWEPDLFFWLGDNIYADTLERGIMSDLYKIQRSVPEYQLFGSRVPQLAIWDDHDYGLNNHDRESPAREDSLALFKRFWANPTYGTQEAAGVFFHYSYGGVDFIFLDNRYHRSPNADPDGPGKTMLGEVQKDWLKRTLRASSAPFKMLVIGGGWSHNPDAFGEDNWTSYRHERNELFDFIRDAGIEGVILMSGDVHRAEANCIPWSEQGGYDLFELVSSGLAQDTGSPELIETPEVRLREPYTGGHNAGVIDFDLTADDPVVRFNVTNITGQTVWDQPVEIRASALRNGVASWREQVDPELVNPRRD